MQTLVYHLVGIEQYLLTYLGLSFNAMSDNSEVFDDEDFDEWHIKTSFDVFYSNFNKRFNRELHFNWDDVDQ